MPYKFDTEKKKLPRALDRRVKLTDIEKLEIKELIAKGFSDTEIGEQYGVSRKTIYYIRKPEQLEKARNDYKLRRLDGRYYDKEKHRLAIKSLRDYKKENISELI